jgi:hypothetical protein
MPTRTWAFFHAPSEAAIVGSMDTTIKAAWAAVIAVALVYLMMRRSRK